MVQIDDIVKATERISGQVLATPLLENLWLSAITNANIYLKWESLQITGSFKLRGALNKLLCLKERGVEKVLAVSAGNHGLGVAYASKLLSMNATVIVPKGAAKTKMEAIKSYGADLKILGSTYDEAELLARKLATEENIEFVSPYNDIELIAGQATVGFEIFKQHDFDILLAPVGGGGLLAGVALAANYFSATPTEIYGVQPANSTAMHTSFKVGQITDIEEKPTHADGLMGNIEHGSVTFPIIKDYVKDILLVSEKDIEETILSLFEKEHMVVEGSGAVAVAAIRKYRYLFEDKKVCTVVTGRNIDTSRFLKIVANL
ncbi:MAG: threonine/serine dehydratase [Blastocatellia bacterium]|nr:threonine/serine dehydratase [Blastocatellia bacterium]